MALIKKIDCKINKIIKLVKKKGVSETLNLAVNKIKNQYIKNAYQTTIKTREDFFKQNDINELTIQFKKRIEEGIFRKKDRIILDIKKMPSEVVQPIIENANRILNQEYTIYGHLKLKYKDDFVWLKDPITSYNWTKECKSYYVKNSKYKGTDIKTLWEIARFQFLSTLSIAYVYTENKKYSLFANKKIKSWIRENQFLKGPHWLIAMESAIRLINWCVYLPLLDFIKINDDKGLKLITESIAEHLIFIRENLEYSLFQENNHYLSNIAILLIARLLFPASIWANECTEFAVHEFQKQVRKQFYKCGINFEGSIQYHRLSSEIALIGIELLKRNNVQFAHNFIEHIRSISKFTKIYSDLSCDIPLIGDNDSGLILEYFPKQAMNNHQYLNILFNVALNEKPVAKNYDDYLSAIHFKETELKCNPAINKDKEIDNNKKLKALEYNGLIIGYNDQDGLFFNTFKTSHGHTHNDKLAVYPIINKKQLFVDRGTFNYTGYKEKRHLDRSSKSHNGPVVNKWEQNRIWKDDVFHISEDANCDSNFEINNEKLTIIGWHDGYKRFRKGFKVFRRVEWFASKRTILINDWIECIDKKEEHAIYWNFKINPCWNVILKGNTAIMKSEKDQIEYIYQKNIKVELSKSSYCPFYMKENQCIELSGMSISKSNKEFQFQINY